ncbi:MAG: hypothetical protein IH934_00735 [Nanoarchaeota archaeon]|nr:hypothetical protein [Nanoarchaeota archaeon]
MAIDNSLGREDNRDVPLNSIEDLFRFYSNKGEVQKIRQLQQDTGIQPPEDAVQQLYGFLLEKVQANISPHANTTNLDNIERLFEETGVQAHVNEESVQRAYEKIISTSYGPNGVDTLLRITGVKPSEEMVQNAYVHLLEGHHIERFVSLARATGIKLPEDYAREIFLNLMNSHSDKLGSVIEVSGVKLSENDVSDQYFQYASIGRLDSAKRLREATGMTPPEDEFRRRVNDYLTRARTNRRKLEDNSGKLDNRNISKVQIGRLDQIKNFHSEQYVIPSQHILTEVQNYISQNIFYQK